MAQEEFLDDPLPDIIEQWRYYFSLLQPQDGDMILDIGCNTGDSERLLLQEYPNIQKVVAIENNKMRYEYALAKWQKCGSPPQCELKLADAQKLQYPDNYFNRAFCVETLEWIADPLKALHEIKRVIKPGGTVMVIHSDFDTQVYACSDKRLCRKIITAFSDAGPNGQIGRDLYGLCKKAGFQTVQPFVYPLVNTEWKLNSYAYKAAHMIINWLSNKSLVTNDELKLWMRNIDEQSQKGSFFYSINRNICRCLK